MTEALKQAAEFNRYFTSSNGVDVGFSVGVPRDEWRTLYAALTQATASEQGEPDDIEAIIACLGDDAATLRDESPEIADNLDAAAEALRKLYTAQPAPAEADSAVVADVMRRTEMARAVFAAVRKELQISRVGPWPAFDADEQQRIVDSLIPFTQPATAVRPMPEALWEALPGHLIDRHEGETLTEELLQRATADLFARISSQPTTPAARPMSDDYTTLFNAIGKSITWRPNKIFEISVAAFKEAIGSQHTAPAPSVVELVARIKNDAKHAAYMAEIDNTDARDNTLHKLALSVDDLAYLAQHTAPAVPAFTDPQIDSIGLSDKDSGHQIYSFRKGFKRSLEMLSCAPAVPAEPWPKLDKPATVGAGTFGVGVSSRLVVEAAQRAYKHKSEQTAATKEEMQADEVRRRAVWDMVHGAPAAVPEDAPITWPTERDVGRFGDMHPSAHLRVGLDSDNDVYVSMWGEDGGGSSVEFCNPGGGGGGSSSRTRMALIALMAAMEADNAERPDKDWWARRNGTAPASTKGGV